MMRSVLTPQERHQHDGFSFERMNRTLDEMNRDARERERIVFGQLPQLIRAQPPYPEMTIERSSRYRESVALVIREEKRRFFLPHVRVHALDIWLHGIPDLADELEFFEQTTVAGDSFQRTATSTRMHGQLVMRCESGRYELELTSDRIKKTVLTIPMGLFQWRQLVAILRGFGLAAGSWKKRNET